MLLVYASVGDRGSFGWNGDMTSVGGLDFRSLDLTTIIATTPSKITTIPPIAIPAMAPVGIPVGLPPPDTTEAITLIEGAGVLGLEILEMEVENGSWSLLMVVVGIGPLAGLVSSR